MTTEPFDLSALIAALRAGDASAMQALYERYAPQLYRYSLFRLGDAEAAQDIVQEVFVQVWHGVRTFEYRGDAALVAWLHTIASHAVINHVRKLKRQPTVSLDATGDWQQLHGTDLARAVCERLELRQALAGLSADQHHVVALRYFAGLTNAEAALVLGRTEGAIKALHHRALRRLHQCLTAEAAAPVPLLPGAVLA